MKYPGTIISAYISIVAYDQLEELREIYGKSRSQIIEAMIKVFYDTTKEEMERTRKETSERTEQKNEPQTSLKEAQSEILH